MPNKLKSYITTTIEPDTHIPSDPEIIEINSKARRHTPSILIDKNCVYFFVQSYVFCFSCLFVCLCAGKIHRLIGERHCIEVTSKCIVLISQIC